MGNNKNFNYNKFVIFRQIVKIQKMQNTSQFLSIIKNFMIDLHSQLLNQPPILNPEHIETVHTLISQIDRAVVQLKTGQQNISSLQNQNNQFTTSRQAMNDYKKQCEHLEKRLARKSEQIQILKQTVKTLYADNQKIVKEKQDGNKETAALKENVVSLKKKIKRQEEEMGNHKSQLQKLSSLAEERLNEYLKEDQDKQMKIKRLQSENQKLKSDLNKKQKILASTSKKIEELKNVETQYQTLLQMSQTLKYENSLLKSQVQSTKQKIHTQKIKILQQNQSLLKQIQSQNEKISALSLQKQEIELKFQNEIQKNQSYEEQIVMRTEKLKEKNKQIKVYNQEIQKLGKRVKELSEMADQVMNQNRGLGDKCRVLELKIQEFKVLYSHVGKLKGEINQKKSVQLARLIESINKLQASL